MTCRSERIAELQAAYDAVNSSDGDDYELLGRLDCAKGGDIDQDAPSGLYPDFGKLDGWQRGFLAEQKRQDDLVVAEWKSKGEGCVMDARLTDRAWQLLHRFATENNREGWFALSFVPRWKYAAEPLRNDAANLLRSAGATVDYPLPSGAHLVGDVGYEGGQPMPPPRITSPCSAREKSLENALRDMLPENCGLDDDPSGRHRPGFLKCERARDLLAWVSP